MGYFTITIFKENVAILWEKLNEIEGNTGTTVMIYA